MARTQTPRSFKFIKVQTWEYPCKYKKIIKTHEYTALSDFEHEEQMLYVILICVRTLTRSNEFGGYNSPQDSSPSIVDDTVHVILFLKKMSQDREGLGGSKMNI